MRVQTIDAGLTRPSEELLSSIDLGSSDLGAVRVAWARAGVSNPTMAEGIRIASASYRMLRATYGREGLRHRQGGDLSAAELRQLRRVRQAQQRFAESLRALRNEARRRGDRATAAELDRFRAEAERIAWAPFDLESYLNALISSGELRGEWEADRPYVRKAVAPKKLAAADQAVQDLYVDSDIGQVFTVDLGAAPNAASDAVQVYQAADGEAGPAAVAGSDRSDGFVESDESEENDEEVAAQEPATESEESEEVAPELAGDQTAVEEAAPAIDPVPETSATPATAQQQDPSKTPSSSPADPPKPPPIG